MTILQILGNLLSAAVGFGLLVALFLGEPLRHPSRLHSLIFGVSSLVALLALLINRIIENPPGAWWWLGVGACGLGVLASVGWIYVAVMHWPKEGATPQKIRLRPAALFLLLLGDVLFLAAFRVAAPLTQVALVVLGCLVLGAFTKVIWVKPQAT